MSPCSWGNGAVASKAPSKPAALPLVRKKFLNSTQRAFSLLFYAAGGGRELLLCLA
jgi:hypothetical protein